MMYSIESILENLKANGGSELILTAYSEPRIKTINGWIALDYERLDHKVVKNLLYSILTDQQQNELNENGFILGSVSLSTGINISFKILKNKLGFTGFLKEINLQQKSKTVGLINNNLKDQLLKRNGLYFICGPSGSGKTTLLNESIQFLNDNSNSIITVLESTVQKIHHSKESIINQIELGYSSITKSLWKSLESSDVIVIDLPFSKDIFENIIEFAESGKLILYSFATDEICTLVNRINQSYQAEHQHPILNRWLKQMNVFVNLRLIKNQFDDCSAAQEIIIFNDQIRKFILSNNYDELYTYLDTMGDNVGMRSLNHAILNLYNKNKIHIRDAFLNSPRPENLDKIMTELGA